MGAVQSVFIEQEEVDLLRKAFIHRTGMMTLLSEKQSPTERDYEVFAEKDEAYKSAWDALLAKYFPTVDFSIAGTSWACDFSTREILVTQ